MTVDAIAPTIQQQLGRTISGGMSALAFDAPLLIAAFGTGMFTALLCAIAPLATSLRPHLVGALQSGSRTTTEGLRSRRIRATLIALEIAASLPLVTGTTLMLRTVISLLQTDLGFSGDRILNTSVTLRPNRYPDAGSARRFSSGRWHVSPPFPVQSPSR